MNARGVCGHRAVHAASYANAPGFVRQASNVAMRMREYRDVDERSTTNEETRMKRSTQTLCVAMTLLLTAAASGPLLAKNDYLPAPGEVRTYFENGVEVGRAVHNQCTGQISVQGRVTPQYTGSFTVSC